jgi:hypothetical protein
MWPTICSRSDLQSDRYDIVVHAEGVIDMDASPESAKLMALEEINRLCCDLLSARGMDGEKLRDEAPKINSLAEAAVTVPHSRERKDLIQKAKSAGELFHATAGRHINSDKFFIANARKDR